MSKAIDDYKAKFKKTHDENAMSREEFNKYVDHLREKYPGLDNTEYMQIGGYNVDNPGNTGMYLTPEVAQSRQFKYLEVPEGKGLVASTPLKTIMLHETGHALDPDLAERHKKIVMYNLLTRLGYPISIFSALSKNKMVRIPGVVAGGALSGASHGFGYTERVNGEHAANDFVMQELTDEYGPERAQEIFDESTLPEGLGTYDEEHKRVAIREALKPMLAGGSALLMNRVLTRKASDESLMEKTALNAQKAHELAKGYGLIPEGAWQYALRNLRKGKTPQDLGSLSPEAYKQVIDESARHGHQLEVGALHGVSSLKSPVLTGKEDMMDKDFTELMRVNREQGQRAYSTVHTHPGAGSSVDPSGTRWHRPAEALVPAQRRLDNHYDNIRSFNESQEEYYRDRTQQLGKRYGAIADIRNPHQYETDPDAHMRFEDRRDDILSRVSRKTQDAIYARREYGERIPRPEPAYVPRADMHWQTTMPDKALNIVNPTDNIEAVHRWRPKQGLRSVYFNRNASDESLMEKTALNAFKARQMAQGFGLKPEGAWKWALRNLRAGKTPQDLGALHPTAYKQIMDESAKHGHQVEVGALHNVNSLQSPIHVGDEKSLGYDYAHLLDENIKGARLPHVHTHPTVGSENVPNPSGWFGSNYEKDIALQQRLYKQYDRASAANYHNIKPLKNMSDKWDGRYDRVNNIENPHMEYDADDLFNENGRITDKAKYKEFESRRKSVLQRVGNKATATRNRIYDYWDAHSQGPRPTVVEPNADMHWQMNMPETSHNIIQPAYNSEGVFRWRPGQGLRRIYFDRGGN